MRTLLRIVLAAGTMMALAMTLALGFDESGIDYTNEDVETAYVMLDRTAEGLTVFLSADKATGFVATMDVEDNITDFDEDDFASGEIAKYLGSRPWAPRAFPGLVELMHASSWYRTVRLVHNQSFSTVTAAYTGRLAELGYTLTEEPITSNITVYTATQGDETIRTVIVRKGADTTVTLTAL